jgi:hypothetical protein
MYRVRNWVCGSASDASNWLRNAESLPKKCVLKYCLQRRIVRNYFWSQRQNVKLKQIFGTSEIKLNGSDKTDIHFTCQLHRWNNGQYNCGSILCKYMCKLSNFLRN